MNLDAPESEEGTTAAFVLDQFLPYRLNHLADRVSESLARVYREKFGLSVSEWRMIALYGEHDRLTSKQISSMSRMDKTRVSRVIAELDRKQLIEKLPHETGKRATYIMLSDSGKKLLNTLLPRALRWEDQLFSEFDSSEYRELFRLLAKLDKGVPFETDALESEPEQQ